MCKTKSSTAAIAPKTATSPPNPMVKSLSGDSTASGNSSSYTCRSSSASSVASLSSARETLPENPHIFSFYEIRSATNNFLAKKLSSSASSATWRCVIRGHDVAVIQRRFRKLALSQNQTHTEEIRDRLSSVCRSHHASLVRLRGTSVSGNYIYLVYDYIKGATLAQCLRSQRDSGFSVLSSWMSRAQIASDLAHGLDYIHNSTGVVSSAFVHNHIKSSSVVVTEPGLHAKICHFGTAELCGEGAGGADPGAKFEGTRGYMSPEFQASGVATQKSDVYAFGVVVLEILSGEEPLKYKTEDASTKYRTEDVGTKYKTGDANTKYKTEDADTKYRIEDACTNYRIEDDAGIKYKTEDAGTKYKNEDAGTKYRRISVVETAREAMEGGGVWLRRWMDKRLRDSYPVEVAERMVRVGLDCVEDDPEKRPDMGRVVGRISRLYLDSKIWAENMGGSVDYSVSLAPR